LIGGLDLVVVREAANLRQKLEHCQEIDVAIEVTGGAFRGKPLVRNNGMVAREPLGPAR